MPKTAKADAPEQFQDVRVRLDQLHEKPGFNPRGDLGDLDDLKASIAEHGLLNPITVCQDGGGEYFLVAGARRVAACRALGYVSIAARSVASLDIDSAKATAMALDENVRLDLPPLYIARAYRRVVDQQPGRSDNAKANAAAKALGRSDTTILRFLRLLDAPESIQARLSRNEMSPSAVDTLMSVPAETRQAVADRLATRVPSGENISTRAVHQAAREVAEDGAAATATDGPVVDKTGDADGFEAPAKSAKPKGRRTDVILWRGKREVREEVERLVGAIRLNEAEGSGAHNDGNRRALAALMWVCGMLDSPSQLDKAFTRAFDEVADDLEERKRSASGAPEEE